MSASNAFVEGFADFWKAPSPDRLTDHLHPDVVLVRPLSPPRHGLGAAQREFTRILGLLPDLHGEVDRWSQAGDVVFIEFRLIARLGSEVVEWPVRSVPAAWRQGRRTRELFRLAPTVDQGSQASVGLAWLVDNHAKPGLTSK